jgi:pyruvate/oxaloacetate carboxyltransferase
MFLTPLTSKVVAYSAVPNFDADSCIDWAIEMIELGYTCGYILVLAGLSKPANYFETISYLNKALAQLHLQPKTGEDGIISYCSYYISVIAGGENVKNNLDIVHQLASNLEPNSMTYNFCLLRWAWDDLDYDENAFPTYWDNATKNNIEQLVIDEAKNWLEKNKPV